MQEHTILNLTPFSVYNDTADRHCGKFIGIFTTFINVPAFENITLLTGRKVRFVILILIRDGCSLYDLFIIGFKQFRSPGLDNVVGTIEINTIHIGNVIDFTVIVIVQIDRIASDIALVRSVSSIAIIELTAIRILGNCKSFILRRVLLSRICITGSGLDIMIKIISLGHTIDGPRHRIIICLAGNRLIINMIGPVIKAGVADDQEVAVRVIRKAKNVIVHHSDNALDRITAVTISVSVIGVALQSGTVHHYETDSLCAIIIGALYLIICRPFRTDVLSVIRAQREIRAVIVINSTKRRSLSGWLRERTKRNPERQ